MRLAKKVKKDLEWRELPMLGPEPPDDLRVVITRAESQPGGVVAVRYVTTKSTGSGYSNKPTDPVDVELAWWTPASGVIKRAKLPGYPPFRLPSRWSTDITAWIDGEHLWFHGGDSNSGGRLYRLPGDPKKPEDLAWPTTPYGSSGYGVVRVASRTVLFSRAENNPENATFFVKEDEGAWTKRVWSLAPPAPRIRGPHSPWKQPSLQAVPSTLGAAFVASFFDGPAGFAFVAPMTSTADPSIGPGFLSLSPATTLGDALAPCTDTASAPKVSLAWVPGTRHPMTIDGAQDSGELVVGSAETVLRAPATGSPCGVSLAFSRWNNEGGVIPLADLSFGLFISADSTRDPFTATARVRRMSCTREPGAKLPASLEDEEGFWK